MSEQSYQDNVARRVIGGNCLCAAYDRISPTTGISTQTYVTYDELRTEYQQAVRDDGNFVPQDLVRKFEGIKQVMRAELGVYSAKNIVEARVDTEEELLRKLSRLSLGGYRTAVYLDVGGLHAVGVIPAEDEHFLVRSTWTPFWTDEPVSVSDIFSYLDLAPRQRKRQDSSRKTMKAANIVALPPEPRY